jgi:hypothetical protein
MSRKFRWFLLASCAFVVAMGAGDVLGLFLAGPSPAGRPSEQAFASSKAARDVEALARGEARRP